MLSPNPIKKIAKVIMPDKIYIQGSASSLSFLNRDVMKIKGIAHLRPSSSYAEAYLFFNAAIIISFIANITLKAIRIKRHYGSILPAI